MGVNVKVRLMNLRFELFLTIIINTQRQAADSTKCLDSCIKELPVGSYQIWKSLKVLERCLDSGLLENIHYP